MKMKFDYPTNKCIMLCNGNDMIDIDDAVCMEPFIEQLPRTFLLRWNPAISSFKWADYCRCVKTWPDGFCMDWSVHEWKKAREGDRYYMLRVGEGGIGLMFHGEFLSPPYEGEDWAGRGIPRHYVDINCQEAVRPGHQPHVTTAMLQDALPEVDWNKGHSGVLLSLAQAKVFDKLWNNLAL